jgi:hypothetical protein
VTTYSGDDLELFQLTYVMKVILEMGVYRRKDGSHTGYRILGGLTAARSRRHR